MTIALTAATAPTRRAFLGVERSVCGRAWRDRLDERGAARALAITQRHDDVPELLARILAGRGIEVDAVTSFLDPTVRALMPDPNSLADMRTAAVRLADGIMRGETIAILGDYDVDGATSAAVLGRYLLHCGVRPLIHIPDRLFEGYGPNAEAIRSLAARGASLLVAVDCGTTSHEPMLEARKLGLDVVVIDHHQADELLPAALAVVNPNRLDDLSQLGHLAAVGLVFMTVVAVNRELRARGFWTVERPEPDLLGFLDLVALGTVADVVPLKGLNRAFVAKGLVALRRRDSPGLTALMDIARIGGPPEPWHLGFLLGPRINAGGRIGRATLGVDLLLQDDPSECARLAGELDRLNRERQVIEVATVAQAEAEAMAALGVEDKGAVIVTAAEGWHPGVVGLGCGAPQGAVRAACLRHCVGARRHRHRLRSFDRGRRPGARGPPSGQRRHSCQRRRPRHGGRRYAAQGLAKRLPGLSRGHARVRGRSGAARGYSHDRRRRDRLGGEQRDGGDDRTRGSVRGRQSGADDCASSPHFGLCRGGRAGAHARAVARGRRFDHRCHRISLSRPKTRNRARAEPRTVRARRRHLMPRPLERRRTGAIAADRHRPG